MCDEELVALYQRIERAEWNPMGGVEISPEDFQTLLALLWDRILKIKKPMLSDL